MSEEIATIVTHQLPLGTWAVDASASRVRFAVGNLWGLAKVRGEFESVGGALAVGPDSLDGQLTIDTSSLNTRNKRRDVHLRSADSTSISRELVGLAWNRLGMIGSEAAVEVELTLNRDE